MKTKAITLVCVLLCTLCCTLFAQQAQVAQPQYPIGILGQQVSDQVLNFTLNGYYNSFIDSSYLPLFSVGRLYQGPRAQFQYGDVSDNVFQQTPAAVAAPADAPAPAPAEPAPAPAVSPIPSPAGGPAAGGDANTPTAVNPQTATASLLASQDSDQVSSKDAIYGHYNPLLESASIDATSRYLYQLQLDQIFQVSDISRNFDDNILTDSIIQIPTLGWKFSNIQPAITADPNVQQYQFTLGATTGAGSPTINYLVSLLADSTSYKLVPFDQVQPAWATLGLAKQPAAPEFNDPFDKNYRARILNMQLGISDIPADFWKPAARFLAVCYRARTFDMSSNIVESASFVPLSNNAFSIRKLNFNQDTAISQAASTLYAKNYRTVVPGQHQDNKGLWWQGQDWSNLIGGSYEVGGTVSEDEKSRYTSPSHLIQGAFYLNPLAQSGVADPNAPLLQSKPIYARISSKFGGLGCVLYERFSTGSLSHNMWFGLARSGTSNNIQSGSEFSSMPNYNSNSFWNDAGRTSYSPITWIALCVLVVATLL